MGTGHVEQGCDQSKKLLALYRETKAALRACPQTKFVRSVRNTVERSLRAFKKDPRELPEEDFNFIKHFLQRTKIYAEDALAWAEQKRLHGG